MSKYLTLYFCQKENFWSFWIFVRLSCDMKINFQIQKGLIETAASGTTFWTNFQTKYFLSKFELFLDRHTKIISIRWVIKADKFSIAVKCLIQKFFTGTTKILKLNWDRELRVFHSPKKVLKFLENFVNFSNSFCQVVFWNSISRFKNGVIETVR